MEGGQGLYPKTEASRSHSVLVDTTSWAKRKTARVWQAGSCCGQSCPKQELQDMAEGEGAFGVAVSALASHPLNIPGAKP